MRLYPDYVVFLLIRVVDNIDLLQKCFQRKGETGHMIIKLVNVHARAQYLYEMNQRKEQVGVRSEVCSTWTLRPNRDLLPRNAHCLSQELLHRPEMCLRNFTDHKSIPIKLCGL